MIIINQLTVDRGNDMLFTKEHTQIAKGAAILLMLLHHLFGIAVNVDYFQNDFFSALGGFGKVCVSMYAFMSGYGLYLSYKAKGTLKPFSRILSLYLRYWIVLVFAIIPSMLIFDGEALKIGIVKTVMNFLGLYCTWNPNAWFMFPYFAFILLLPAVTKLISKIHNRAVQFFTDIFILFIIPIVFIVVFDKCVTLPGSGMVSYFLQSVLYGIVVMIPFFSAGYIFAKYNIFSKLKLAKLNIVPKIILSLFLIVACYFIRKIPTYSAYGMTYTDLIIAPVLILSFSVLIMDTNIKPLVFFFKKMGVLSCNIWLVHYIFCQGALNILTYAPKYPIIIFLFTVVLTVVAAIIIEFIYSLITRLFGFIKNKIIKTKQKSSGNI